MIFIAKGADFSAKNIGIVEIDFTEIDIPDIPSGGDSTTKVTMIDITNAPETMVQDETVSLSATVYPSIATDKTIVWSVSPTSAATINSETGELTVLTAGTVTVRAKATDGSNISGTAEITVRAKTKDDCSDLTKTVLGYYGTHHTDALAVALDKMITALGADNENSIWSKMDVVMLPFLANDINDAFRNAKTGKDHMEYTSSGKINATNNSIDWNTIYTVLNGCVKCLDTSNTKNTLNIPIYRFNNAATGITGSKFSLIVGGNIDQWAGGTGCMIPITTSTLLYSASASSVRVGADYSTNCLKGLSINYVSETEGYENTVNAPASKISTTYGSQEILHAFATSYNGAAKHWNTYMRTTHQFYTLILSQYLTSSELELAISEIDKLAKVFNVDLTV